MSYKQSILLTKITVFYNIILYYSSSIFKRISSFVGKEMDSEYLKMSIYSPIFTPFWGTKKTRELPLAFS